ncbi:MAG: hypothetical protein ACYTF6_10395 [Planctomycetota bacterium]|jgi:hypothetical protein
MFKRTLLVAAYLIAALGICGCATTKVALEPDDVLSVSGDGPDGQGNTADDTWGFWFQLINMQEYRRLDIATASMTPEQRKDGIPRKVQGPIGAYMPNAGDTEGWIYHSDWDGRYEGVWGDRKAGQVIAHPYNEKTDGGAMAITYKVPADGTYVISAKVTDLAVNKSGHKMMTGIDVSIDVVAAADAQTKPAEQVLAGPEPVGDAVGPESREIKTEKAKLTKGKLVRLVIDPRKWWGADMTRIDYFKIERVR